MEWEKRTSPPRASMTASTCEKGQGSLRAVVLMLTYKDLAKRHVHAPPSLGYRAAF